jgi:hypothetical protein
MIKNGSDGPLLEARGYREASCANEWDLQAHGMRTTLDFGIKCFTIALASRRP